MSNIGQISGDNGLTNQALSVLKGNSSNAQEELKALFKDKYFNNGQTGIDDIDAKIKEVEKLIKSTEDEITKLNQEIDDSNKKINGAADELSNIVKQIAQKTEDYQEEVEDKIEQATYMAVAKTKADTERISGKNDKASASTFADNFRQYFNAIGGATLAPDVSNLFNRQNAQESKIKVYIDNIDGLIQENGLLCNKMQNAKSTKVLLQSTQKRLTTQKEGYKNTDNSTAIPIYSPEKEKFMDDMLVTYTSRLDDNTDPTKKANTPTLSTEQKTAELNKLSKQYAPKNGQKYSSGDKYNINSNPEISVLDTAVKDGMLGKLADLGLNRTEIIKFVESNFNVGIAHKDNGDYTVPYGHNSNTTSTSAASKGVYNNFISVLEKETGTKVDPNKTIGGNNQMKELQKAINDDKLLDKMANKGFTFKEAMYALTKLFPNANIGYDLSKQGSGANYTLPYGDDDATHKFLTSMSDKTKTLWGVGANMDTSPTKDPDNNGKPNRTDPIGFKIGDTNYEFLTADAMDNGKFDGISEMLGSKNGMQDLQDLAKQLGSTNGVISGEDALSQVIVMEMKHVKQTDGSYKLEPSFTNAWDLGIREIDTAATAKTDKGKTETDYTNINDSLVQNTFNITMLDNNGNTKTIQGEQKYETDDYINATYGKAYGENIFSQLSSAEVDKAFSDNKTTNNNRGNILQDQKDELQAALDASESAIGEDTVEDIKNGVSIRVDNSIAAGYYEYKKDYEMHHKNINTDDYGNAGVKDTAAEAAVKAFEKKLDIDKLDDFKEVTGKTQDQVLDEIKGTRKNQEEGKEK